jgi:hypothetical protein
MIVYHGSDGFRMKGFVSVYKLNSGVYEIDSFKIG